MRKQVTMFAAFLIGMAGLAGSGYAQSGNPSTERFVLTGVVYVEGGRGVAWLQEPTFTDNRIVTLRLGDNIGPYKLTKIMEDQVELEGPSGKVAVPLAGTGGAISVAAIPTAGTEPTSQELPPHPALNNPDAIVVARGDPSRNFPSVDLLIGAGAELAGNAGRQISQAQAVTAPSPAMNRGVVPAAMQLPPPELPPHNALGNPDAAVVPRGDPRRAFPAASLLIGAGAQVTGAQ